MPKRTSWTTGALGIIGVGCLAIVLIANVKNAVNRQAYDTTEWNMMGNGMLLEIYRSENGTYPDPGYTGPASGIPSAAALDAIPSSFGAPHPWEPHDGWNSPLLYRVDLDGLHYALISGGSNDEIDQAIETVVTDDRVIDDFDEDVVFRDGSFVRWRQGWCCNTSFREDDIPTLKNAMLQRADGKVKN